MADKIKLDLALA